MSCCSTLSFPVAICIFPSLLSQTRSFVDLKLLFLVFCTNLCQSIFYTFFFLLLWINMRIMFTSFNLKFDFIKSSSLITYYPITPMVRLWSCDSYYMWYKDRNKVSQFTKVPWLTSEKKKQTTVLHANTCSHMHSLLPLAHQRAYSWYCDRSTVKPIL